MGFEDRRQFPRFPCRFTAWVEGPRGPMKGACTDLSMGGAFIEGVTSVHKDAVVTLSIEFAPGVQAVLHAQVRRVDPAHGVGVQFIRLEPQAVSMLQHYAKAA